MKQLILIFAFLVSSLAFAQSGDIVGFVNDVEDNNDPLVFAKISIKETGTEVLTDENGQFTIKDIEPGDYTIVFSFVGYDSLEKSITIRQGRNVINNVALTASTLDINELMSAIASADQVNSSTQNTTNN